MPENDQTAPETEASALRRAAEEGAAAKKELEQAKREVALLRAGVDLDSKAGQMFAKAYDGDLTAEAIQAEWADIAPKPAAAPAPPPPDPEEARQTAERLALANDSTPPGAPTDPDPNAAGMAAFQQALAEGRTREDAAAEWITRVNAAGAAGDSRVLYRSPAEKAGLV